jgi:V/A-type H+-transporting ATPase subunit D
MARLKLSKSALQQQNTQLRLYQKLLPSLDMKRRQLMVEHKKAREELEKADAAITALETKIGTELPMIAATEIDLSGLVRMTGVEVSTENIAGVKVPRLDAVECETARYSYLVRPPWVDRFVERLRDAAEQRLRARISGERAEILGKAVRRITQRVNLFDRILIPTAKENIRRIRVYLSDVDREAVVRSKLSKAKHEATMPIGAGGAR